MTPPSNSGFDSIPDALAAFKNGNFIVVMDDTSRENEGDLIIAAEDMTPEKMSFMVRHTSGLICTPVTAELADRLDLPLMIAPKENEDPNRTAYTVSIDAQDDTVTTGISAHDRALTCSFLAGPKSTAASFRRPGHVFPLRARPGLIRQRQGHTEAAVELCRLTGKTLAGVISEIVDDGEEVEGQAVRTHGGMMRRDACLAFGKRWGMKVCTIEDLVQYVEETEGKLGDLNGTKD